MCCLRCLVCIVLVVAIIIVMIVIAIAATPVLGVEVVALLWARSKVLGSGTTVSSCIHH